MSLFQIKLILKLNQAQELDMVERTVVFMPDGAAVEMSKINGVWTSIPNTAVTLGTTVQSVTFEPPTIESTFEQMAREAGVWSEPVDTLAPPVVPIITPSPIDSIPLESLSLEPV